MPPLLSRGSLSLCSYNTIYTLCIGVSIGWSVGSMLSFFFPGVEAEVVSWGCRSRHRGNENGNESSKSGSRDRDAAKQFHGWLFSPLLSLSLSHFPSPLLSRLSPRHGCTPLSAAQTHRNTREWARAPLPSALSFSLFFFWFPRTVANLSGVASPHYERPRPTVEI